MLKQRVRDRIDPKRDLGHSDTHGKKKVELQKEIEEAKEDKVRLEEKSKVIKEELVQREKLGKKEESEVKRNPDGSICEDCR